MEYTIVNAVASKEGGALTVLQSFIKECNPNNSYIFFIGVSKENFPAASNIRYIEKIGVTGLKRFIWDCLGVSRFIKSENISVYEIISLQNTGVKGVKGVKQSVYYHQAIPLTNIHWNPFKKGERQLAFYKYIYPFFVKFFDSPDVSYIVQASWVKNALSSYFKFNQTKVFIEKPLFKLDELFVKKSTTDLSKHLYLFYPASEYLYKNHHLLIEALNYIKKIEPTLLDAFTFLFTLDEDSYTYQKAQFYEVAEYCDFLGFIDRDEVFSIYQKEGVHLIFPSVIETLGLPLLEASYFGCDILVSDLPYSRETLINSSAAVRYVKNNTPQCWGEELISFIKAKIN
ncbi:hypothetical protein PNIG_a0502 [Pseudoalteromonas nigrifaciens]|uniref:Glycosyl transferase family 1 domain-containing protein n=1 Tax=Pseudoalteromonas nigrifaciens TaxID=28109 RepID=A0AAC9UFN0_9GAMM|nr:glycosyltransferase [Pseudoalteromonas nigrifaciens]ASM52812.1 hypothetical protein PNIG_a0502 [Pseudoalteromonas nigrifaciens]GEN43174.1 hypothetical protein PNI02_26400 [Pseudoalteromonas nigrifaciens]SUC53311.1 Glycosyl transferases group 1 [Pseudoalteromonas nigrifaciens]